MMPPVVDVAGLNSISTKIFTNAVFAIAGMVKVSVGALDMVNFAAIETVPSKFEGRNFYKHNPTVTLMRTTIEENRIIGKKLAEKLNMASEKTTLFIPLKGVSLLDIPGQPFYGKEEDNVLFDTLRNNVNKQVIEIAEMNNAINDKKSP